MPYKLLTKSVVEKGDIVLNTLIGGLTMAANKVYGISDLEIESEHEFLIKIGIRTVNSLYAVLLKKDGTVYFGKDILDKIKNLK